MAIIKSLQTYWGEVVIGSRVWFVNKDNITTGAVANIRLVQDETTRPTLAIVRYNPIVDIDTDNGFRVMSVGCNNLYATQYDALAAFIKEQVKSAVQAELAVQKEQSND